MGKVWEMEPITRGWVIPGAREHQLLQLTLWGIAGGALSSLTLSGLSGLLRLWTEALRQREADVGGWKWAWAPWRVPALCAGQTVPAAPGGDDQ